MCKAVSAISIKTENTLVMYGVYNAETLERLVKTVHMIHSRQCTKTYLQVKHQQHMNIIHKCMANESYSTMQLIQCYT